MTAAAARTGARLRPRVAPEGSADGARWRRSAAHTAPTLPRAITWHAQSAVQSALDTLDTLDQLRQPLIRRTIALIGCFGLLLIGLSVASLVASRRGQLDDTAQSTGNMADARLACGTVDQDRRHRA